jgi:TonB-dependent SusC/RagA subfamily outer membrane receptor
MTQNCTAVRVNSVLMLLLSVSSLSFSQQVNVTGRITDPTGEGIPGVNVIVKGTSIGTATDLTGRYAIRIEPGVERVLVISFVGYKSEEIVVGLRTEVDVQMTSDLTELEEIVVTGYSTIRKSDVASSIAVVDVDDMKKIAASNFAEQLQGKVAGVQVSTSGGPGSLQYVRIRGIGTINNNEPLYVIDGVPVQNETDMNFLNPNDIETMQVLKDAAASSIYGARAANGVVVITTKRGTGRAKINFDFFTGMQYPQEFPELANPSELLEIQKGLSAGAGNPFNSTFYIESPKGSGNWVLPDFMVKTNGYADDPDIDPSEYVLNTSDPESFGLNFPIASTNIDGTNWFDELFKPAP